MGPTEPDFACRLHDELRERLVAEDRKKVHFDKIYYQDVFQGNQNALWQRLDRRHRLDWRKTRQLFLYGFSDAAGYEHKADKCCSHYEKVQEKIRDKLHCLYDSFGNWPIVLVAQSLGGHVISNYIWDAQQPKGASRGVWKSTADPKDAEKDSFLRLHSLCRLYTTGCNIPIFLAGLPKAEICAIQSKNNEYNFEWHNYYDVDDPLGWPLKPLSESYRRAVSTDEAVNVGGLFSSWNPASHTRYWADRDVLQPLAEGIHDVVNATSEEHAPNLQPH